MAVRVGCGARSGLRGTGRAELGANLPATPGNPGAEDTVSDERPPTPDEVTAMHLNVGRRLAGLIEIARKMDDDPEWVADKVWLVGTASDVTDYIDMAVEAASRLRSALIEHERERVESREGMVTVYDYEGRYVGCMGVETWRAALDAASTGGGE